MKKDYGYWIQLCVLCKSEMLRTNLFGYWNQKADTYKSNLFCKQKNVFQFLFFCMKRVFHANMPHFKKDILSFRNNVSKLTRFVKCILIFLFLTKADIKSSFIGSFLKVVFHNCKVVIAIFSFFSNFSTTCCYSRSKSINTQ